MLGLWKYDARNTVTLKWNQFRVLPSRRLLFRKRRKTCTWRTDIKIKRAAVHFWRRRDKPGLRSWGAVMTRDWGENARSEKTCGEVDQRRLDWEQHAPSKVLEEPRGWAAGAGVCPGPGRAGSGGEGGRGTGLQRGPCAVRSLTGPTSAGAESLGGESFWAGMEQRQGRGWAGGGPVGPTGQAWGGPGALGLREQVRGGAGEKDECTKPALPAWPHTTTTHWNGFNVEKKNFFL